MNNKVKAIPEGYHSVTPYLIIDGAAAAIEFYKRAFDAVETHPPFKDPKGKIGHAELRIGDSPVMLADEFPEMGHKGAKSFGGSPVGLMLYVENVDKVFETAVKAGAKVVRPLENQFYGDRNGQLEDPFGHSWTIASHVEDVPLEELNRRAAKLFGG